MNQKRHNLGTAHQNRLLKTCIAAAIFLSLIGGFFLSLGVETRERDVRVFSGDAFGEALDHSRTDTVTATTGIDAFIGNSFGMYNMVTMNFGADEELYCAWESAQGDNTFFPFRSLIKFDIEGLVPRAWI